MLMDMTTEQKTSLREKENFERKVARYISKVWIKRKNLRSLSQRMEYPSRITNYVPVKIGQKEIVFEITIEATQQSGWYKVAP